MLPARSTATHSEAVGQDRALSARRSIRGPGRHLRSFAALAGEAAIRPLATAARHSVEARRRTTDENANGPGRFRQERCIRACAFGRGNKTLPRPEERHPEAVLVHGGNETRLPLGYPTGCPRDPTIAPGVQRAPTPRGVQRAPRPGGPTRRPRASGRHGPHRGPPAEPRRRSPDQVPTASGLRWGPLARAGVACDDQGPLGSLDDQHVLARLER
jgi:hypothetical protein